MASDSVLAVGSYAEKLCPDNVTRYRDALILSVRHSEQGRTVGHKMPRLPTFGSVCDVAVARPR